MSRSYLIGIREKQEKLGMGSRNEYLSGVLDDWLYQYEYQDKCKVCIIKNRNRLLTGENCSGDCPATCGLNELLSRRVRNLSETKQMDMSGL